MGMMKDIYTALQDWADCPVCGEWIDYCQGHGTDDTSAHDIFDRHDFGDHSMCHPLAVSCLS